MMRVMTFFEQSLITISFTSWRLLSFHLNAAAKYSHLAARTLLLALISPSCNLMQTSLRLPSRNIFNMSLKNVSLRSNSRSLPLSLLFSPDIFSYRQLNYDGAAELTC